ncbi:hypothetical protein MRX96_031470 [Rhipicephalus microplus]
MPVTELGLYHPLKIFPAIPFLLPVAASVFEGYQEAGALSDPEVTSFLGTACIMKQRHDVLQQLQQHHWPRGADQWNRSASSRPPPRHLRAARPWGFRRPPFPDRRTTSLVQGQSEAVPMRPHVGPQPDGELTAMRPSTMLAGLSLLALCLAQPLRAEEGDTRPSVLAPNTTASRPAVTRAPTKTTTKDPGPDPRNPFKYYARKQEKLVKTLMKTIT